jgi:nicotinate dehydrogenase subunit B
MNLPVPLKTAPRVSDWLRFGDDGLVHVTSGRVELGQGNLTALLQIAADELELAPEKLRITGGDTLHSPDEGFTSGSMSITHSGQSIRWAASAARQLLVRAAAAQLGQSQDALSIRQGQLLCQGQNTALDLWQLAKHIDWSAEVAPLASPKPAEQRRVAGQSVARVDLAERVAGTPFVHDMALPDMLYGRVLHPPCYGARLQALDLDALRARAGLRAVWRDGELVGLVAEQAHQVEAAHAWASQHARWDLPAAPAGDPVALMAASTEEAVLVHQAGEPATQAAHTVRHQVSRPYLSHGSIGPSAAVAWWRDGHVQVWSHTQGPYPLREALAMVMDLPLEKVDVTHQAGAGCYGHNGADDVALDAALLARSVPGHPVKVIWSRADEFQCAPMAPAMVTTIEAQLDAQHQLQSMAVTVNSAPHGNRPGRNGSPNLRAAAFLARPMPQSKSQDIPLSTGGGADRNSVPLYNMAHVQVHKRLIHELPYRTSSMRALGATINVYAIETLMDRLADQAQADPIDYRLRHLSDPRARDVLNALQTRLQQAASMPASEGAGWGVGFAKYKNAGAYCAIGVRVVVQERVRVTHAFAVLDGGEIINPDGVINQTEGGMLQALSWAVQERMQLDGPSVATQSWLDYPILKFSDVPHLEVRLIERPELAPMGCAEAAQGPMVAAIGNAVFKAIGVQVHSLPITHEALVQAALNPT